jgi:hypothetical protein
MINELTEQGAAMSTTTTTHSSSDVFEGVSAVLVGGGAVTLALFPLALPIIALTVIAAIPLVLVALAAGLVAAAVAAPILLVRRLLRELGSSGLPRSSGRPGRGYSSESQPHAP